MTQSKTTGGYAGLAAAGVQLVGDIYQGRQAARLRNEARDVANLEASGRYKAAAFDKAMRNNELARQAKAQMYASGVNTVRALQDRAAGQHESSLQLAEQLGRNAAGAAAAGGYSGAADQVASATQVQAARARVRSESAAAALQQAGKAQAASIMDSLFRGYDSRINNLHLDQQRETGPGVNYAITEAAKAFLNNADVGALLKQTSTPGVAAGALAAPQFGGGAGQLQGSTDLPYDPTQPGFGQGVTLNL